MVALEYRSAPPPSSATRAYWLLFYRGKLWQHGEGDIQSAMIAGRNYPYGGAANKGLSSDADDRLVIVPDMDEAALVRTHREQSAARGLSGSQESTAPVYSDRQARVSQRIAAERYRTQALIEAEQAQRLRLLGIGSRLGDVHRMQSIGTRPMGGPPIQCTTIQHGSFSSVDCR
jgi:hypothetical protein